MKSTLGNSQRNVSQGGGRKHPLSAGDERREQESANLRSSGKPAGRVYHINPSPTYRRNVKLDTSDYPGKSIYQRRRILDMAAETERGEAAPGPPPGLSNGHIQSLLCKVRQRAQIEIWRGGSLVHCQRDGEFMPPAPTKRGSVLGFSRKSRSRMIATQGKIRWSHDNLPFFMGNTCPDEVPSPKHVIAAWQKFSRRFERRFPVGALLWRKEIKDRKSGICEGQWVPHYHSFAYNCARKFEYQEERGDWVKLHKLKNGGWRLEIYCMDATGKKILGHSEDIASGTTDRLAEWWSRNWYEAMGSGELKHYQAGASFDHIRTIEGVRYYTSKYMAKVETAGESPHCTGRWWGIIARKNIPWSERVLVECSDEEAITIMRVLRRYVLRKAKRKFRCNHVSMNYLVNDPGQWERFIESVLSLRNVPF